MAVEEDLYLIKKYGLVEVKELLKIKEDLQRLVLVLEQKKSSKLVVHFETELIKEEEISERISKNLLKLVEKLDKPIKAFVKKHSVYDHVLNNFKQGFKSVEKELRKTLVKGELHKLVGKNGFSMFFREGKIKPLEISRIIEGILGEPETRGLRHLLKLIEELEQKLPVIKKLDKGVLIVGGYRIPPGFILTQDYRILTGQYTPEGQSRQLGGNGPVFVQVEDKGFDEFRVRCKKDTKELSKYLDREQEKRNLSIYFKTARLRSKGDKWRRKIKFRIDTLFFSSFHENLEGRRMKMSERGDEFTLHIDYDNHIQWQRTWNAGEDNPVTEFRSNVNIDVEKNKYFLNKHYGDWKVFAHKLVDIVEEHLPILEKAGVIPVRVKKPWFRF